MTGKTFKIVNGDIRDGYHTFDELYEHRIALFLLVLKIIGGDIALLKNHYEGWDCVYLHLKDGQISYHIPSKYRVLLPKNIRVVEKSIWDGHTSNDVISRIFAEIGG